MDCYYKLRQLFYYKVQHSLLQIATGITKCDGFITNCDRYYEVRWLLQIATEHRYPWICSARPSSFTCFKMADVYHGYWSKFPSQSEASIRFLFRDQVCFSTSLLNLMYLSIFVRVAKNLALYLYPRFMLSIQHVSIVVHNLWKKCIRYFYSQCAVNNVGHIWLMSSSRCWDGRWCP